MPLAFLAIWAHCINQHPQANFFHTVFQPLCPKPVAFPRVVDAKVPEPALGVVEPHPIGLCQAIQPVQIPLLGLSIPRQISISSQLGVICKLNEVALKPLIHVINTDIEEDRPQYCPLKNTTHDSCQLYYSIYHHILGPDFQPFFTQQRVYLSKPLAASFSWRILWETVSKALLKSR